MAAAVVVVVIARLNKARHFFLWVAVAVEEELVLLVVKLVVRVEVGELTLFRELVVLRQVVQVVRVEVGEHQALWVQVVQGEPEVEMMALLDLETMEGRVVIRAQQRVAVQEV